MQEVYTQITLPKKLHWERWSKNDFLSTIRFINECGWYKYDSNWAAMFKLIKKKYKEYYN